MTGIIVCIGGINLDRKLRPLASLTPGSSNPCEAHESPGGVARNVAENLARLGQPVALLGATGDDLVGRALLEHAQLCGIDVSGVLRLRSGTTDSYTALLTPEGEMSLGLAAMPLIERVSPWSLEPSRALRSSAALVLADGNLTSATIAALIEAGRSGPPLVFICVSEPKMPRLPQDLRGMHLILINRGELSTIDPDPATALARLHQRGVPRVLVTLGAEGVRLSEAGRVVDLPAEPIDAVVDVTGAGDALAAGVCHALVRRPDDFEAAARLGLRLAALTLQTPFSVHPALDSSFLNPA